MRYLAILSYLCFVIQTNAQELQNSGFEQACDTCGTGLAHWKISWQSPGSVCKVDGPDSDRSLLISGNDEQSVGFVEQTVPLHDRNSTSILTLSVEVRSDDVHGGRGAGIYLTGVDADDGNVFSKDLGFGSFNWVLGTQKAGHISIRTLCPPETVILKVGLILYGAGSVWFDDAALTWTAIEGRSAGAEATAYVQAAVDTIAEHSLRKDSVDLDALRITALRIAGESNDPADHHLAVEYLLAGLQDHHSFLMPPDVVKAWEGGEATTVIEQPDHKIIRGCGYISIPHFPSRDTVLMKAFVDTIQNSLARMDTEGVKGWVVDLRNNMGGNMSPMICGLGPLLDEGVLGQLFDVNGKAERWIYREGVYYWEEEEEELRGSRIIRLHPARPIAVLTGERTGSSGECTAISFIGNSNTRSFGKPTWGLTTGNGEFDLPDGAKMFLASTIMADRTGRKFHGPIAPDVMIEEPVTTDTDPVLEAAFEWIEDH